MSREQRCYLTVEYQPHWGLNLEADLAADEPEHLGQEAQSG